MTSDIDIFRSAKLLIDRHGATAPHEARRKAHDLAVTGDIDGAATWQRIMTAVGQLQMSEASGAPH